MGPDSDEGSEEAEGFGEPARDWPRTILSTVSELRVLILN